MAGDFSVPKSQLAAIDNPTLVLDGGATPWLTSAADAVAAALPNADRHTLTGQPHNVAADALAPALAEFLADGTR